MASNCWWPAIASSQQGVASSQQLLVDQQTYQEAPSRCDFPVLNQLLVGYLAASSSLLVTVV